jgi:Uma2 family endonuclease
MTAAPSKSSPFVDGARMTAAEYFALPETKQRCDLIDGVLYVSPSPDFFHQSLVLALGGALDGFARRDGGAAFVAPMDVEFDLLVTRQPDAGYIRPGRVGIIGRHHVEGPPDLVVEVHSPSNRRIDTGDKLELYARYGVAEIWLVDPVRRTVTVHTGQDGRISRSRTVSFGEPIPSSVVDVGAAGLGAIQRPA